MNEYLEKMKYYFHEWGTIQIPNDFMLEIRKELSENGFFKNNSRLIFSVCSDDVNRLEENDTIENNLTKNYNGEFHLGGLGGYPIGGVSGITAASHHPLDNITDNIHTDGTLIFFISPHMGLAKNDIGDIVPGKLIRPGQNKLTSSCGAIMGFLGALKQAGSPNNFKITPDERNTDPTRIILHNEMITNYSKELSEILTLNGEEKQVIEMFKLNYYVIVNKGKEMFKEFLEKEKEHFKGNIAMIGGINDQYS